LVPGIRFTKVWIAFLFWKVIVTVPAPFVPHGPGSLMLQ
jgi:hypothetical protein